MMSTEHPIPQIHGRVTILDKSAFEGLTLKEHMLVGQQCFINVTPILVVEILGDLAKQHRDGRPPRPVVSALAKKLNWSHGSPNMDFISICFHSLLGHNPGEIGKCLPDNARRVPDPSGDGSYGIFVDDVPFSEMLLRWAYGQFSESETEFAGRWRHAATSLNVRLWDNLLLRHRVLTPRVATDGEIAYEARGLLGDRTLAGMWLELLIEQMGINEAGIKRLQPIVNAHQNMPVEDWAPYAGHCLRAIVYFILATRSNLIPERPTNLLDLQYLFYLPFCTLFASEDKMHRRLAPLLLAENQAFMLGSKLKGLLRSGDSGS